MPGLILSLEPGQGGPNFPRCDLSQPFPFKNKAPVPALLSPRQQHTVLAGAEWGRVCPLSGLFREQEGACCGNPSWGHSPKTWLEARGCSGRAFPGILDQLCFPQTSLGRRWVLFLPTILLKRLWGCFLFPFFFLFSPFSQSAAMLEKEIFLCLCASS